MSGHCPKRGVFHEEGYEGYGGYETATKTEYKKGNERYKAYLLKKSVHYKFSLIFARFPSLYSRRL